MAAGFLGFVAAARWLQDDDHEAFALFSESIEVTTSVDGFEDPEARYLAYRAVLSMDRGDWASAERDVELAVSVIDSAHLAEYAVNSIVEAARARLLLHRNENETGRESLFRAMRLRTSVTWVNPWGAVWLRLEMADAHLVLGDPEAARTLLQEAEGILHRRPKLGRLRARADALRQTLSMWPTNLARHHTVDGRTPSAAVSADASLAQGDRRTVVRVEEHGEHPDELDLPEAGGVRPERGGRSGPGAGPPGADRARLTSRTRRSIPPVIGSPRLHDCCCAGGCNSGVRTALAGHARGEDGVD